ncbi:hypothetical protein KO481_39135 [Nocardia sp. NEAU-G5]|uniref:Uncharacterized protein n=1 Tax=Nocardia albiluteola TaxID=2842303 RepID=A0ABS6BB80_9NOCA|nr:hypothetical protein [Nocardia albiluteola]MBU3067524.1 hypothetical protein [Nocardia albiluteola]
MRSNEYRGSTWFSVNSMCSDRGGHYGDGAFRPVTRVDERDRGGGGPYALRGRV